MIWHALTRLFPSRRRPMTTITLRADGPSLLSIPMSTELLDDARGLADAITEAFAEWERAQYRDIDRDWPADLYRWDGVYRVNQQRFQRRRRKR